VRFGRIGAVHGNPRPTRRGSRSLGLLRITGGGHCEAPVFILRIMRMRELAEPENQFSAPSGKRSFFLHFIRLNADWFVPDIALRLRCTACGGNKIETYPDWSGGWRSGQWAGRLHKFPLRELPAFAHSVGIASRTAEQRCVRGIGRLRRGASPARWRRRGAAAPRRSSRWRPPDLPGWCRAPVRRSSPARRQRLHADCPSSDDLRRFGTLRNGGSGPSGLRG
jgi:hypothetical protein